MRPLVVLFLLPGLIGIVSFMLFRSMKRASFAATVGSPLLTYIFVGLVDPSDPWNALAAFLVSPLVIAVGVITVFICSGRTPVRKQRKWNDA